MWSGKCWPFYLSLNVLNDISGLMQDCGDSLLTHRSYSSPVQSHHYTNATGNKFPVLSRQGWF